MVSCAVAGIVCIVAIAHLPTRLSWVGLAIYPVLVGLGVLIHYAMMLMLMSLSFWMTRAQGFINAYYSVFQIARLPREVFFGPDPLHLHVDRAAAADRQRAGAHAFRGCPVG